MRPIFVSYRREDAEGEAGRLFDDLVGRFGENSVFLDVAAIEIGRDFRKAIDDSVSTCGVLLAIIGKGWIDAKDEAGGRRLDDPADFVRLETASALKRDIPVIPVLVHGAKMPRADQLPEDLKELAYRNGVELTHARWRSDLELLIKALGPYADPKSAPAPIPPPAVEVKSKSTEISPLGGWSSRRAILAFVLGVLVVGAGVYWFWPAQRTVPVLTGSTLSDAKIKLEAAALVVGNRTYQVDPNKPADTVLSQAPLPNTRVKSGTAVDLLIVKQTSQVEVPSLKGRSMAEAQNALRNLGLAVGQISREPNSGVAPDTVLSEFPNAGRRVEPGTTIDLVVAQMQAALPKGSPQAPRGPGSGSTAAQQLKSSESLRPQSPSLPLVGTGKGATVPPQTKGPIPNFAGTWELFAFTHNGGAVAIKPNTRPLVVTQDGTTVSILNHKVQISPSGTIEFQSFASEHEAKTADEAELVITSRCRLEDSTLVFETTFDYRKEYSNHPPGRDSNIMNYRRVGP